MKICFICYGNICRSPMAEFLLKKSLTDNGITGVEVCSKATSYEEIGNGVHYGTRGILDRFNIDYSKKRAEHFDKEHYELYDLIICMESRNVRDLIRIIGSDYDNKIRLLSSYSGGGEIADPYWTGDFEKTYIDIKKGIDGLISDLKKTNERV